MTSAKLAIDGGAPFRSQPFGPKWIFGDEERRHLMEVMDNATDGWRSGFKVRAFADAFATLHGAKLRSRHYHRHRRHPRSCRRHKP